jgi:hypothetical protein
MMRPGLLVKGDLSTVNLAGNTILAVFRYYCFGCNTGSAGR